MKIGFKPLHDRVLILRESAKKMHGTIHIPETVDSKPMTGTVMGLGAGTILKDGTVRPIAVKEGDVVMYERYAGFEIEMDIQDGAGEKPEFVVVKEEEILGVVVNG